jgi:hypothetical protein
LLNFDLHDLGRFSVSSVRKETENAWPAAKRRIISADFIYIHQLRSEYFLEEQADPFDDFRRTRSVFRSRTGARLFEIWGVGREPSQAGICVGVAAAIG